MEDDKQQKASYSTVTDAGQKARHENLTRSLPVGSAIPKIKQSTTPEEFDKKSNIFVERESAYVDEFEYDRDRKDQGIVLVFNEVSFKSNLKRRGSTQDVNNIVFTLGRLRYNIEEKYIFSNFSTQEIWDKIEELSKEDLSKRNCLILFFLTHGDQKDLLHTRDGTIGSKDVWEKLGNHKDLHNKPKLFVFQACKGNSLSAAFDCPKPPQQHDISYLSLPFYPLPSDIIICYSSAEGTKSHRHTKKGSWFIQEICRNFLAYGRRDDVFSLLTRVSKCVSTYKNKNDKQMPVILSTLSRKFYLTKTRERHNTLAMVKDNNDIHGVLLELHNLTKGLNKGPASRK